jgi:hypothetical protein
MEMWEFGEIIVAELTGGKRFPFGNVAYDIGPSAAWPDALWQVKTRNHTSHTGAEKTNEYTLYDTDAAVERAKRIAEERGLIPRFACVRVNSPERTVTIYHGRMADSANWKWVPMRPEDRLGYPTLAKNRLDRRIDPNWSNDQTKPRWPTGKLCLALMQFVGPLDKWEYGSGADLAPNGFWAWSFVDHLDDNLIEGDCFIRDNDARSYEDCLADMVQFGADSYDGLVMYIRDKDGLFQGPLKKSEGSTPVR